MRHTFGWRITQLSCAFCSICVPQRRNNIHNTPYSCIKLNSFIIFSLSALLISCTVDDIPDDANQLDEARFINARSSLQVGPEEIETIPTIFTEDMIYKEPLLTIEGQDEMMRFLTSLLELTPDYELEIETEIYDGDNYSATWIMTGTFMGFPYVAPGMSIIMFRPGEERIYFQRDYYSEGDVWAQVPNYSELVSELRSSFESIFTGDDNPVNE